MNKQYWSKVKVKTVLRCHTAMFKCLCFSIFLPENRNMRSLNPVVSQQVVYEWSILRQSQWIHFDFFKSYTRCHLEMVHECAHRVKDSMRTCRTFSKTFPEFYKVFLFLKLSHISIDTTFLAFQPSKKSYLKLWHSFVISFVVPLEIHQFGTE